MVPCVSWMCPVTWRRPSSAVAWERQTMRSLRYFPILPSASETPTRYCSAV